MEADSTTYENNSKDVLDAPGLPFNTCPGNYKLYQELMHNNGEKTLEAQLVDRLQDIGLIPYTIKCPSDKPDCKVACKHARVVDRLQWICETCGKRQPIREGSFFLRLQCTIPQVLQMVLAWCEDAEMSVASEYFGVKPKVANQIYDKLDEIALKEYSKCKLGGDNSVVLTEMYPDCMTRLSPDTTDQSHGHRVLMMADTKHIPTYYRLHVIKEDMKKTNNDVLNEILKCQIEDIISESVEEGSTLVTGTTVPPLEGAVTLQQLTQHCDVDMQHFLTTRIWRQAITICSAARDLCSVAPPVAGPGTTPPCIRTLPRYLHTALYRVRYGDGFYRHVLGLVAREYTVGADGNNN